MMTAKRDTLDKRMRICILVASLFVGLMVWPLPVSAVSVSAVAKQCDPVLLFASGNACFTARHARWVPTFVAEKELRMHTSN